MEKKKRNTLILLPIGRVRSVKLVSTIKIKFHLSDSIEESIKYFSAQEKSIILCVGSLYLCGEILKLN